MAIVFPPVKIVMYVGDLGNSVANAKGEIKVTLFGPLNVTNFGFVIHEKVDDLVMGNTTTSKTVGNSRSRLACGNIQLVSEESENTSVTAVSPTSSIAPPAITAAPITPPADTAAPASLPADTATPVEPVTSEPISGQIYSSAVSMDLFALFIMFFSI